MRAINRSHDNESFVKIGLANTRHGHTRSGKESRVYSSWHSMGQRCRNPRATGYADYGGRGITICLRWQVFENFLADMGERPIGTSLDRIDNDGNYEPSNCRWATRTQQTFNRRKAKKGA